ncbi:protein roadkill-like [Trichogramma pretiosum]|uniref:protein roadkill-like n=1 Tax=Trichogramma pretiosum TaxID=7493 RepID=UPI000C719457|nr:protein roadkill-like [Trichogramma pretiosum]
MSSKQHMKASTTVASAETVYTWTIKNYRLIKCKVGENIESPKFSVGSDNKVYFNLELFPEGQCAEVEGLFNSLYLTYLKTDSTKILDKLICKSTISVIRDKKVVTELKVHEDYLKTNSWGRTKFYDLNKIDDLISLKNTVTFRCELEIFTEYINNENETDNETEDENFEEKKFNLPFPSEELSDIELSTSDKKTIRAHKFVLAMISPVFRAMFTHDMLETKNNTIKIIDTSHNILVEMLRFMYTGEIEINETDMILQLLAVADKYQIDNLKIKCGKLLYAELSTENAIEFLTSANKYNAMHLENKVLKFVTAHPQLLDSEQLKIADPALLLKIVYSLREALLTKQKKP